MIGRRIGNWILERELGRGGMGSVYEARHVSLPTRAAVKVMTPGIESEESFRQRFHREADLQARLRHPNVVRVLDYLEDHGQWFLIVDYLERGSLADLLARGEKVERRRALAWARQALAGLGEAHRNGIVHRDVKPANLLLGTNDEIVVADFGIARASSGPGLTSTGIAIGTPHYMSPEQIVTPQQVDGRADIYSLGVVLYELLAGRKPFNAASEFSVLQAQVNETPPALRSLDPSIPPALEEAVMRALVKMPTGRYQDCESMIRALDRTEQTPAARTATLQAAPPVSGGTVRSSVLFEPAAAPNLGGPSPGELRDRKRRGFLVRLAAMTAAVGGGAVLLAMQLANGQFATPAADSGNDVTSANAFGTVSSSPKPDTGPVTPPPVQPPVTPPPYTVTAPVTPPFQHNTATSPTSPPVTQTSHLTTTQQPVQTPPSVPPPNVVAPPRAQPPAMQPLPDKPQIAVIGMGSEPLLAGSLEQEMESRLAAYGLADEHGDPAVTEILQRKTADPKALGAKLLENGFHILVLLRVEEATRRTQTLSGMDGAVMASRMRMNAYLLPTNRPIGPGWTEGAEYTELSAAIKARTAFIGPTADLRKAIDESWAALRATAGASPGQ
jgi:serine/threonine protein kinase